VACWVVVVRFSQNNRTFLLKRICQNISRLLPKKIIMISCDVAASARDGALLRQHGYRLKALRGLDLFPYTGHVETMSLWEQ